MFKSKSKQPKKSDHSRAEKTLLTNRNPQHSHYLEPSKIITSLQH